MAFNSLDAQREAGCDYIKSQKHQGWTLVPGHYDDGGYSGGTTDRPGLQKLLGDIQRGNVDVVVVYKVDRLSRSLADFARLMQTFDEHEVSFVSVTQQFNTTTSMGRLTLNMLLSFAQFEREVAGERIRDKIAATKRKGVWVGGQPPLGYRLPKDSDIGFTPGDRVLRIVEPEAKLVRAVYAGYLELGSLVELATRLNRQGHSTKRWLSSRKQSHGGSPLTAAFLYRVLTNPIYTGNITHAPGSGKPGPGKQARSNVQVFPGKHQPIIDEATWGKVRAKMTVIERDVQQRWTHTHLLKGKLRTFEGHAMSPGSVLRPGTKQMGVKAPKRRVCYYISQKGLKHGFKSCPIKRVPAVFMDDLVRAIVLAHLADRQGLNVGPLDAAVRDAAIREVTHRVVLAPESVTIELSRERVAACSAVLRSRADRAGEARRSEAPVEPRPACPFHPQVEETGPLTVLRLPIRIKSQDGKRILVSEDGRDLVSTVDAHGQPIARTHLADAIGQAFAWHQELLRRDCTVGELAAQQGVADTRIHRLLGLTHLGPQTIQGILRGELPTRINLDDLIAAGQQLNWDTQARALGSRRE